MKRFLPALLSALLFVSTVYSQPLIPFRDGTRWGYCNADRKIIIPCIYSAAFPFSNNEAVAAIDNKYGLISPQGKWLITPAYDSLGKFENEVAIIKIQDKYGLMSRKGQVTLPAEYKKIELLPSGFYHLSKGELLNGFANKNGLLILPAQYREINDFHDGRALVQEEYANEPWKIINEKGDAVFSMETNDRIFEYNAIYFQHGFLPFKTLGLDGGRGCYDTSGKKVFYVKGACCNDDDERRFMGQYHKGLFPAMSYDINDTLPDGKIVRLKNPWGYCDSTGNFVIKPVYTDARPFHKGVAWVSINYKWQLINEKGQSQLPDKYIFGYFISDNRMVLRDKEENYYISDLQGTIFSTLSGLKVATGTYWHEGISPIENGYATVTYKDGRKGYIDSMGKYISTERFSECTPFRDGLAKVSTGELFCYINTKGQLFYRRAALSIGRQQWDYQDLNTRVFANGDSIYKAVSISDFIQKGQEKKPAFYHVSYIPNTQSKTQLLYNWYAVNDPRGLAPEGWTIPTEEEFMQLKKAGCSDSIVTDVLYALGFDNGGQRLLKETGLGTLFEGGWWTRTNQYKNNDEAKIILLLVSKDGQRPDLRFGVHPCYNGFPVRCIRKPDPVKPGIKLPPLPNLNCDSLLAITKAKVKQAKPVERKTEPVVLDYVSQIGGNYKDFTCVLTATKEVTFTPANVASSHFTVEKIVAGYVKIDFEINVNNSEGGRFFLQFVMQAGEASKTGTGAATRTTIPLYRVESKADPYKPGVPYYRGENVRGTYCPETRTITIYGDMVKMYNSSEVSRTKYRITGVK